MTGNAPNLRSLDALRGILATYVLCGHARFLLWTGHAPWMREPHAAWEKCIAYASAGLQFGYEAVMVFFVLSGFFIHFRAAQAIAGGVPVRLDSVDFFKRRAHRILPPYFLALAVTVLCDALGMFAFPGLYRAQTGDALLDLNFARKGYDAVAVVPALLALPSSLGRDFGSNGPLWSLAFEVCYYAAYPAWYRLRLSKPFAAFVVVPVACIVLGLVCSSAPLGSIVWLYPMRIVSLYPVWISGALLAECALKTRFRFGGLLPSVMLLFAGVAIDHSGCLRWLEPIVASVIGAAAVSIFFSLPASTSSRVWHRICEKLGVQSYTIYITHFPLLTLGCAWLFTAFGGRPSSGYAAACGAVASLLVCSLLFFVCERHFLHRRLRVAEVPHGQKASA